MTGPIPFLPNTPLNDDHIGLWIEREMECVYGNYFNNVEHVDYDTLTKNIKSPNRRTCYRKSDGSEACITEEQNGRRLRMVRDVLDVTGGITEVVEVNERSFTVIGNASLVLQIQIGSFQVGHAFKDNKALADLPGLGGYEIMNEPCGSVQIASTDNNCTNTIRLQNSGAGWTKSNVAMSDIQRFVNLQSSAIHKADPKTLVTVGIWNEQAGTDKFGYFNYFKDECLIQAGGKEDGVLDFQQLHTYAFNNKYDEHSPINQVADDFGLDVPLVIGEFENQLSAYPYTWQYEHYYDSGYNGAWAMNSNGASGWKNIDIGMDSLKGKDGVKVDIDGNDEIVGRCWCSDVAPDNTYTCQQQAGWGKCKWMDIVVKVVKLV